MEKSEIKRNLLDTYLSQLRQSANNAKVAMEDHQNQANDYGQPKDRYDSFRTKLLRMRDMFAAQYQKILDEIQMVEKINPDHPFEKPGTGAVLLLSQGHFFMAPGGGKVNTEAGVFTILTPQSPLGQAVRDLRKGDTFVFNGRTHTILDIF